MSHPNRAKKGAAKRNQKVSSKGAAAKSGRGGRELWSLRMELRITAKHGRRKRIRTHRADFDPVSLGRTKVRPGQAKICAIFGSLGHAQRVQLLLCILRGGGTYADLKAATGLQPGPLYHHINELRMAGLLAPKTRDRYRLTELGVQAVLAGLVLQKAWFSR